MTAWKITCDQQFDFPSSGIFYVQSN